MNIILFATAERFLDNDSKEQDFIRNLSMNFTKFILVVLSNKVKGLKLSFLEGTNIKIIAINKKKFFLFIPSLIREIQVYIKSYEKTVVSASNPFELGIIAIFISRYFNYPLNIQIHTDVLSRNFKYDSIRNFFYFYISKIVIFFSNSLRVVNTNVYKKYEKKNIILLPDVSFNLRILNNKHKVNFPPVNYIYPARYVKMKNHLNLLKAFQSFIEMYPDVKLHFYGEGPYKQKILTYARQRNLTNHVTVNGYESNMDNIWGLADYLVFPSLYEGYGMIIEEALTQNIPVIATPFGGSSDLIVNNINGFMLKGFEAQDILDGLVLSQNQRIKNSIGYRSRTLEEFSSEFFNFLNKHFSC